MLVAVMNMKPFPPHSKPNGSWKEGPPATITYFGRGVFTMFGDMRMGDYEYSANIHYTNAAPGRECHPFATAYAVLTNNRSISMPRFPTNSVPTV